MGQTTPPCAWALMAPGTSSLPPRSTTRSRPPGGGRSRTSVIRPPLATTVPPEITVAPSPVTTVAFVRISIEVLPKSSLNGSNFADVPHDPTPPLPVETVPWAGFALPHGGKHFHCDR